MLFVSVKERIESNSAIKLTKASWYKNWELYPILLFATFLRFYRINTSEFDFDQALIYRMAYDAVHHGLWPVTNSTASLGFANAPGELYLLMLPAALSANPVYGFYLVSLLASLSVLITYIFTTRYYGRLAGAVATLLYAAAAIPLYYARFLWQPNMMFLFVVVFMFMLFIGVVERRKGWFGPALILLAMLYQTHGTTLTLAVPLILAICMAFKTIRWRDVLYGIIGCLVIFFPFILWLIVTRFSDLSFILAQNAKPTVLNNDSWVLYRLMISPYDLRHPPDDPHFWARTLIPMTSYLYHIMGYLVICGCVLALGGTLVLWRWRYHIVKEARKTQVEEMRSLSWWNTIPALPPDAGGLLLLCAWQITPIIAMIKHSSNLYPQYMLVVLPGPFILISYLIVASEKCVRLLKSRFWTYLHAMVGIVLATVIVLQLVNSVAILRDYISGPATSSRYNTLYWQQQMINDAERLAQQHHLKRLLIGVDESTAEMMLYLGEHTRYPASVFFIDQCMLLPSPADGPAILLLSPSIAAGNTRVEAYGAHLLEQAVPLNSRPFSIYELPSAQKSQPSGTEQNSFMQNLQSLGAGYQDRTRTDLFTRWSLLRSYPLTAGTTYSYHFTALPQRNQKQRMESTCTFATAHMGDQLLPSFAVSAKPPAPTTLLVRAQFYATTPDWPMLGPFHLETHRLVNSQPLMLHTSSGRDSIDVSVSKR